MNSTFKTCLAITTGIIITYITYTFFFPKREPFFQYGMHYGITKRLLDIFDAPKLSDSEYLFDMTPKQRFDQYITYQRQNIIKHPKSFNSQQLKAQHDNKRSRCSQRDLCDDVHHGGVSQSLINDFYLAARLALIAYQTDPRIITYALNELGIELVGTVNDGNVYVYVAKYNGKQILCIQGTEFIPGNYDIWQVWSDLSITPRFVGPYADMYVHSGFYDDVASVYPQISNFLNFNESIWVIGHSLGAVRAMLIRSLIPSTTNVRITTFGCPRGASQQFFNQSVNIENTVIEQVVAERDFAYDFQPLLPYYHAIPYFYWLTNDSIYYTKERDWLNLSFDDHSIANSYLVKLAKLAT